MDLAGRKERGKAYCPIVVGSGIVPLPEKKTVKNHKNGCIRMYETVNDFTRLHTIDCVLKPVQIQVLFPAHGALDFQGLQNFYYYRITTGFLAHVD